MAAEPARPDWPLTVVIPSYNEPIEHLQATLEALGVAADRAALRPEVLVVDDGSDVPLSETLAGFSHPALDLTIQRQTNSGRLAARRNGLEAVQTEWVLLLDSRITLVPGALAYAREWASRGDDRQTLNGHVHVLVDGRPYGRFWRAVTDIAWFRYFGSPREMSYGVDDFDQYPKGTSMFLARTDRLLAAMRDFTPVVDDERLVSDDTAVIKTLAEDRIWLCPEFACTYEPRTTAKAFFKQVFYRGTTFYDGFSRPGTSFTTLLQAFPFVSVGAVLAVIVKPRLAGLAVLLPAATGTLGLVRRIDRTDTAVLSALSIPFAAVYSAGIWRGIFLSRRGRSTKKATA